MFITLEKGAPTLYRYRIDRHDYATHTTVYEGDYFTEFCDKTVQPNATYVYTITPIYKDREGISVTLPSISTDTQFNDKQMTEKEWW